MEVTTKIVSKTALGVATALLFVAGAAAFITLPQISNISVRHTNRNCKELQSQCYQATARRHKAQETICARFLSTCGINYGYIGPGFGYGYNLPLTAPYVFMNNPYGYGYNYGYGYMGPYQPMNPSYGYGYGYVPSYKN